MRTAKKQDLVQLFVDDLTDYAIVVFDVHGVIQTWNAGARALLGYTSEEIVGRRLSDLYTKSDGITGKSSASLKDALQWGRHETTARLAHKNGTMFDAQIVLRPLSDEWGNFVGFGLIAFDIDIDRSSRIATDKAEQVREPGGAASWRPRRSWSSTTTPASSKRPWNS